MKPTSILFEADSYSHEETPKKGSTSKVLNSLIVVAVLILITMLSSCVATVRTPQYTRSPRYTRQNVTVVQYDNGVRHDNGNHYGWFKRNKKK